MPTTQPLWPYANWILLLARVLLAAVMLYYGWPKVTDTKKQITEFEQMGFKPGWIWVSAAAVIEIFGGLLLLFGLWPWLAAGLFSLEMLAVTLWKRIRLTKPFSSYSYDLAWFAIGLLLLAFGPGRWAIGS